MESFIGENLLKGDLAKKRAEKKTESVPFILPLPNPITYDSIKNFNNTQTSQ